MCGQAIGRIIPSLYPNATHVAEIFQSDAIGKFEVTS